MIAIPARASTTTSPARIDRFIVEMEEASVELVDALTERQIEPGPGGLVARRTRTSRFVRSPDLTEIPAASMSDIAFLLLIFYISTSIFRVEQGIPLLLPRPGATPVRVAPEGVVEIEAFSEDLITMDGAPVALWEIAPRLEQRLAENPDLIVSVATEPETRYRRLVDVLDELQKARATRISLRTGGR